MWKKSKQAWEVYIRVDGELTYVGSSKSFEEAVGLREAAEMKYYGFIKEQIMVEKALQFFVADALGGHLFFRTNSRAKAQRMCDDCFGPKYTVKVVVRASVR